LKWFGKFGQILNLLSVGGVQNILYHLWQKLIFEKVVNP
jgi:hypothetical protein